MEVVNKMQIHDPYNLWKGLKVIPKNIPQSLKCLDQWVLWRVVDRERKDGTTKKDKIPYQVNGNKARINDSTTWADFESVLSALNEDETLAGIGFVLSPDDNLYGLDFDHVVNAESCEIKPNIQKHIDSLGTYTEISPSGTGIRAFVFGDMPRLKIDGGNFELYDKGRFLTITGHTINGEKIKPVDDSIIKSIHADLVPSVAPVVNLPTTKATPATDADMLQVKSALQFIDADERSTWVDVGQMLHRCGHADAFNVWDEWSQKSDLYNLEDSRRVWASYGKGAPAQVLTLGTLFYWAQQSGWVRIILDKHFGLTDLDNGERLIASYNGVLHYCVELKKWIIWNGQFWQWDTDGAINRLAKSVVRNIYKEAQQVTDELLRKAIASHALKSESVDRINAMIKMATTESGVPISILLLDNNPMLLNVANGCIDLKTGELRAYDMRDFMTGALTFNYNPMTKSQSWEMFIAQIFDNDAGLIQYIQKAVGYSLTGNISEQIMFFCFGSGSNGKTTFLNVLDFLMGRHCTRISSQVLTQKMDNNTLMAMAGLKGARVAITSEVEEGQRMAEAIIKDLTGCDKIAARKLYNDYFAFIPTHKLWQYGNHKPQIRGTDDGIWRRIHLIPFTQSFTGKDKKPDLDRELIASIEGVLAWGSARLFIMAA